MQSLRQVNIPINNLLENLGNLVHVTDVQDTLVYANTMWLSLFDSTQHEIENTHFSSFISPEYHQRYTATINTVVQSCQNADIEIIVDTKKGQILILACRIIPQVKDDQVVSFLVISRDMTNVMESHAELERMFRLSRDMLGIISAEGTFLRLNPAWQSILGYPASMLLNKSYLEFVHPDDVDATIEAVQRITMTQQSETFENRYRHHDGNYHWLSWNAIYYPNREHIYFVARDITEQKATYTELEIARIQLHAILDNSGVSIYFKDRFGRYRLANSEFSFLVGETSASIVGKYDEDILPAHFASTIIEHDREVVRNRVPIQVEEYFIVDDSPHTFLSTKFPIFDTSGNVNAVCSISTDITYRKLTEMQLALRNQAIEFSPSAISIADARLPDMPLIYTNPAFEANTGYTALEAIGKNCRFLQGTDRDQPAITIIREAIRNSETCTVTLRNYRRDGTLFYNELRLAPIFNTKRELTHYVGISTDVTERVKTDEKIHIQNQELMRTNHELADMRAQTQRDAERIFKQNEELLKINHALGIARKQAEDATRLKSQFLATMSHELRTPLNAIIGYTEIQLAGMTGELNGEQKDYQGRVLANAEHLLSLINDVLDIAKIEAGRMELVNKTLNIRDWVDELIDQTTGLAEKKNLLFDAYIDERMPQEVVVDPARLRQIAINLISNAFKFTVEGSVRLHIHRHGNDAWKLAVTDTGVGIPSHMQETIFEEFRQVDSSSQRKQGGTGLGLSIVRKLCLMMGGNIRLQSQVGTGSTFTIILPLIHPEKQDLQSDTQEENRSHD